MSIARPEKHCIKVPSLIFILLTIYKGLWVSDKVPNQEAFSKKVSQLLDEFEAKKDGSIIIWLEAFFITFNREWNQIDYFRINKYLSLVTKMVDAIYQKIKEAE